MPSTMVAIWGEPAVIVLVWNCGGVDMSGEAALFESTVNPLNVDAHAARFVVFTERKVRTSFVFSSDASNAARRQSLVGCVRASVFWFVHAFDGAASALR